MEDIAKAWQLHQAGALTLDEFTAAKQKILAAPVPAAPSQVSDTLSVGMSNFFGALISVINEQRPAISSNQPTAAISQQQRPAASASVPSTPAPAIASVVTGAPMDMSDAFTKGLPQKAEAQKMNKPRKRLQQPDLYAAGVQSVIQVGGKKIRLGAALTDAKPLPTSLKIKQRSTVLQCRWCDEKFNHAPARTIHEKTHTGPQRGQSSLFDLKKIREQA